MKIRIIPTCPINIIKFLSNLTLNVSYRFGEVKEQIKKTKKSISNNDVKAGGSGGGE